MYATFRAKGASKEVRFTIRRIDYHAPRRYAVFTGVSGFADSAQVFDSPHSGTTDDQEFSFLLPDTPAYSGITGPMETRIVGYSGQYGGHKTSLVAFKLYGAIVPSSSGVRDWCDSR